MKAISTAFARKALDPTWCCSILNCAVPDNTFAGFAGVGCAVWLLVMVLIGKRLAGMNREAKATVHITRLVVASHFALLGNLIGYAVQGGLFEVGLIFVFLWYML
jgi:hypothetical protein